jgi:hypothetical protein
LIHHQFVQENHAQRDEEIEGDDQRDTNPAQNRE